ncbi:MAG TPA: ATP-binding protein [Desulfobacterales bacterium]
MKWHFLKKRSLSKELTTSLILLVFLFEGVLLATVYKAHSREELARLRALADQNIVNLAEVLAVPIWDFDDEQIAKIGRGYVGNEVVDEIRVLDAGGKVLYQATSKRISAEQLLRSRPIFHRGRQVGTVELVWSLDAYTADRLWLRNVILMILGASLIVIFFATGLLLRIFMRRPLNQLQDGIDRVAQGEFDYRFDKIHHSELTDIARRFSQMADTVRTRESALQQEIGERRRAEEKTRESEAKTRALLDALPDVMFRMDSRGVFLEYRGAADDLHIAPNALLNRKVDEVLPDHLARRIHRHLQAALRERSVRIFEYELQIEDRRRHFECRLVAVGEDQAMAIIRDITDRVRAAAERRRLEDKLRQAQKMEAVGTLAGGVAHDLNNVLSGLVSYPQLLLMDLAPDSPLYGPIQTIQRSGEKAAGIVQDLLTLARRGVAVAEIVNLNDLIRDYLQSPEFEKLNTYHPGCEIDLRLSDDLFCIRGSAVHLSKMIMNLVSNAAEAIHRRGRIVISTANRFIEKSNDCGDVKAGDAIMLRVSDDGIGISPEDIQRIFEPFYTKKAMGRSGTGLGMSVVWGTVKDHRGHIEVKSDVGLGTRFTVFLPACHETRPEKPMPDSWHHLQGRGETILVVDDMPEQLEIAAKLLQRLGYRALTAADGLQAIDVLANEAVDLIVLDMIMEPGIDGLETYRRILQRWPGHKAVIASGFSESARVRQAQALGAGAYIKKPYRLEQIGAVVRAELDRDRN